MWVCEWMVIGKWQECSSSALVLYLSAAHLTLIESVCRWTKRPQWPLAHPLLYLDHTLGRLFFALQAPDPGFPPKPALAQKHWDVPPSPIYFSRELPDHSGTLFLPNLTGISPCISAFPPKIPLIASWLS